MSVPFRLKNQNGAAPHRTGVAIMGAIPVNVLTVYIPQAQKHYVDYMSSTGTAAVSGTVTQSAAESNGVFATAEGVYWYTSSTRASAAVDQSFIEARRAIVRT